MLSGNFPGGDPLSDADDLDEVDAFEAIEAEDAEPIEAYCVRCRIQVEIVNPEPVWTSRGQPGTRGTCPDCGSTVFRMGQTPAHRTLRPPPPVRVEDAPKVVANRGHKRAQPATYINAAEGDYDFAAQLAKELDAAGVHTWFDPQSLNEPVAWAGGVHPALRDCVQMVIVWSAGAADSAQVKESWTFFKTARKPIAFVLIDDAEVPDALRRSPRFDTRKDYKAGFRQLLQTLGEWIHSS